MQGYDTERKRDLQRSDTRRRLISAAADEFARHGFANARVRHIVDQAQANLAAVNYHFGGKDGLYRATLIVLAANGPTARPRARLPSRKPPEERLRRRVMATLRRFLEKGQGATLGRILAHEVMNPTPHLEEVIASTLKPELDALGTILAEVAPGSPRDRLGYTALGVVGQCLLLQFGGPALQRACPWIPVGSDFSEAAALHIAASAVATLRAPVGGGFQL